MCVFSEGGFSYCELYGLCVARVEDRVDGFGWVGDKVVDVEVGDEVGEF